MTPFDISRDRHLDLLMPGCMLGSTLPIATMGSPSLPSIFECPLSKTSRDYVKRVNEIEIRSIRQIPKSYSRHYQAYEATYPTIIFAPRHIRYYLSEQLAKYSLDIWIGGSSVDPSGIAFNDIDYKLYFNADPCYLSPDMINYHIYKFIEVRLKQAGFSGAVDPHIIQDLYYTDKALFKDPYGRVIGAQYGIGSISFTLFYNIYPHYHSLSPADGIQYHPVRRVCRFSLGQRFAANEAEALYSVDCAMHRKYEIPYITEARDPIFRIAFKVTQEYQVDPSAIKKAIYKWKNEYTPVQRVRKFGKHQLMHYPHQAGKVIDFLNFLSLLSEEIDCLTLAKDWIQINGDVEIGKKLGFGHEQEFAKLIIQEPSLSRHILSIFRGVFLLAWANQKMGQKDPISAYEFNFRKNTNDIRYSFGLSIDKHVYHLAVPIASPTQIATSYLEGIEALNLKFNTKLPIVIEILKPAIHCLGLDSAYLISDCSALSKHLMAAFDAPHVKQILVSCFKQQLKEIYETLSKITRDPQEQLTFVRKSAIVRLKSEEEMAARIDPSFQKCLKLVSSYCEFTDYPHPIIIAKDLESLSLVIPHLCKNSTFQIAGFTNLLKYVLPTLLPLIVKKLLLQPINLDILKQLKSLCHLPVDFEIMERQDRKEIVERLLQIETSILREAEHLRIETKSEGKKGSDESNVPLKAAADAPKHPFDYSAQFISTKETMSQLLSILNKDEQTKNLNSKLIHSSCQSLIVSLKKGYKRLARLNSTDRTSLENAIQDVIVSLASTGVPEHICFAQTIFNESTSLRLFDSLINEKISFALIRAYAHLAIAYPKINSFTSIKTLIAKLNFRSTEECEILLTLIKQMLKKDAIQKSFATKFLFEVLKNEFLEDSLYQKLIPIVYSCMQHCSNISEDGYKHSLLVFMKFSKHIREFSGVFSDDIRVMLLELFHEDKVRDIHIEPLNSILEVLRSKRYFSNLTHNYPIFEAIQKTKIRKLYINIRICFLSEESLDDPKVFLALADYILWLNNKSDGDPRLNLISFEMISEHLPAIFKACIEPAQQKIISDCIIKIASRSYDISAFTEACKLFLRREYGPDYTEMSLYLFKAISQYSFKNSSPVLLDSVENMIKQIMRHDKPEEDGTNTVIQDYLQQFFQVLTLFRTEKEMETAHNLLEEYVRLYKNKIDPSTLSSIFSNLYLPKLCLLDEAFHTKYNRFKTLLTEHQIKITNSAVGMVQIEYFRNYTAELEVIRNSIDDLALRKKRLQTIGLEIIAMISSYKDYCNDNDQKTELIFKFLNIYSTVFNKHLSADIHYLTLFIERVIRDEVFMFNLYDVYDLNIIHRRCEELDKFLIQCMDLLLHSSAPESTQLLMNCLKELIKIKDSTPSFFASLVPYHQFLASTKLLFMFIKGRKELQEYFDFVQHMFDHFKRENHLFAIELHLPCINHVSNRINLYPVLFTHLVETLNKKLISTKKSKLLAIQQLLKKPTGTSGAIDIVNILKALDRNEVPEIYTIMNTLPLKELGEELVRGIQLCKNQSEFEYLLSTESSYNALSFCKNFYDLKSGFIHIPDVKMEEIKKMNRCSKSIIPALATPISFPPLPAAPPDIAATIDENTPSDKKIDNLVSKLSVAISKGFIEGAATLSKKKKKKKKAKKPNTAAGAHIGKVATKIGIDIEEYKERTANVDLDGKESKSHCIILK